MLLKVFAGVLVAVAVTLAGLSVAGFWHAPTGGCCAPLPPDSVIPKTSCCTPSQDCCSGGESCCETANAKEEDGACCAGKTATKKSCCEEAKVAGTEDKE